MRFKIRCTACGNEHLSPEGRKHEEYEEAKQLVADMGLVCRVCDGPVELQEVETGVS